MLHITDIHANLTYQLKPVLTMTKSSLRCTRISNVGLCWLRNTTMSILL